MVSCPRSTNLKKKNKEKRVAGFGKNFDMSASPIARQATQSQNIPSKRIVIHDPNQMPADYSSTPGGTLYSTTPGGQFNFSYFFFSSQIRTEGFWEYHQQKLRLRSFSEQCSYFDRSQYSRQREIPIEPEYVRGRDNCNFLGS